MLYLVFAIILAVSFVAQTKPLVIFGVFYSVLQLAHHLAFDGGTAAYSYASMSGSLASLILLAYLSVKYRTKWQLLPLSIIMFASIIHGYYGVVVYNMYSDVETLNVIGFAIYAFVIAGLLWSHNIGKLVAVGGSSSVRSRSSVRRLGVFDAGGK